MTFLLTGALLSTLAGTTHGDFATSGRLRISPQQNGAGGARQSIFGGGLTAKPEIGQAANPQPDSKSIYHDSRHAYGGQGDPFLQQSAPDGNHGNDMATQRHDPGRVQDPSANGQGGRDERSGWVHPSVVRVRSVESDGISNGSGTLIGVDEKRGYIITNWHVVKGASGTISVEFPDGFRSAATVMKMDKEWDLAILVIWKPTAPPMPLSPHLPSPGEPLIIAGYGQGAFRSAEGTMTEFVAPSDSSPFEMFEVSTAARQGDSGGPIVNRNGQLAGVLFGAGDGRTTGSHVGRLRAFLDEAFRPSAPAPVPAAVAVGVNRGSAQQPAAFHQTPESEMDRLAAEAMAKLPSMPEDDVADVAIEIPGASASPLPSAPSGFSASDPAVIGAELYDANDPLAGIPLADPREYRLPGITTGSGYAHTGYASHRYRGGSAFGDLKTFFTMFGIFAVVFALLPRER